jgi:hypothetical protein
MSQRLILLTVPPPATLRDQDAADLEMLVAALKWRESAELTGPDEFGQLSGNRWHVVLRQFLDETTSTKQKVGAAELEYLVKILKRDGTKRHGTARLWADILGRFIRYDYEVHTGRPKQDVRDRLLSQHYWLLRRVHPNLTEDDCAESVALTLAEAGGKLSASRVKRIAKSAENRKAAIEWINEQIKALTDYPPELGVRALLATFEPIAGDRKVLAALFGQEVK